MRYNRGQWSDEDPLDGMPDDAELGPWLTKQGWDMFLNVGEVDASAMSIRTHRRTVVNEDGGRRTEYLLAVHDPCSTSEHILVDTLPDLMDLMARWAPVAQAANISELVTDLNGSDINPYGLLEGVAARWRYGAERHFDDVLDKHLEDQQEQERRRRERAASRKASGAA